MTDPICNIMNCGKPARWSINVLVWSVVTPWLMRTKKKALRMMIGLAVCDDCRRKVKPEDLLADHGTRSRIAAALFNAGRAAPDFKSAKVEFVRLGSQPSIAEIIEAGRQGKAKITEG